MNKKPLLENNLYHISSSLSIYIPVVQEFRNFTQRAKISPKMKDLSYKEFRIRGIFVYF